MECIVAGIGGLSAKPMTSWTLAEQATAASQTSTRHDLLAFDT